MTAVTYVLLVVLGVLLAVIGAFIVPVRLFGHIEGLAAVVAIAGNLVVALGAAYGLRSRHAATAPAAGWLLAAMVLVFMAPRGGGVLVPGSLGNDPGVVVVGTIWLLGGVLAFAVAIALAAVVAGTRKPGLHRSGESAEA